MNCDQDANEVCDELAIDVVGHQFNPLREVNGHPMYKSADGQLTLCFSLGDLVGGGQWLVKDFDESDNNCSPDCAQFYAQADKTSRCVVGTQFKKFENSDWVTTSDTFHQAISAGIARE